MLLPASGSCVRAQKVQPIQMHVATLVPALLLGVVGGLLAALFTRLNTFICQRRALLLAKIRSNLVKRLARMLETVALVVRCLSALLPSSRLPYFLQNISRQSCDRFATDD